MMCGCERHHDMTSRCTCTCPSHADIRAEQEPHQREWKPGDLALDTEGRRIFRHGERWIMAEPGVNGAKIANRWNVENPRPLAVVDPEDREAVERLVDAFRGLSGWASSLKRESANALQQALREFADPPPPKPDEPTGLGAVVRDREDNLWVAGPGVPAGRRWEPDNGGDSARYRDIDAVEVLSEGVIA